MDIDIIRTDREHADALKEIEGLGDPDPDTPEGIRFLHLVDLVEAYEETRWPIDPPSAEAKAEYEREKEGEKINANDGYKISDIARMINWGIVSAHEYLGREDVQAYLHASEGDDPTFPASSLPMIKTLAHDDLLITPDVAVKWMRHIQGIVDTDRARLLTRADQVYLEAAMRLIESTREMRAD